MKEMCSDNMINWLLVLFQVIIAYISLRHMDREKNGLFQIGYSNYSGNDFEFQNHEKWKYDLNKRLLFKNIGDDSISLSNTKIYVNNKFKALRPSGKILSISNKKGFDIYEMDLGLTKEEKTLQEIDIKIELYFCNSHRSKIVQIIEMKFEKIEQDRWELMAYNWEFKYSFINRLRLELF